MFIGLLVFFIIIFNLATVALAPNPCLHNICI